MANSAINLSYSGNGPTGSGQVFAASSDSGAGAQAIDAFGTSTTDNSAATIAVNFIDGTKTLSFTPSAILASIYGATGSVVPQAFKVDTIANTGFVVTGAANWPAGTVKLAFRIIK
jgi:hypothetical protein